MVFFSVEHAEMKKTKINKYLTILFFNILDILCNYNK